MEKSRNELKNTNTRRVIYLGNQKTYPPKSYTFAELAAETVCRGDRMTPINTWEDVAKEISESGDIGVIAYKNATVGVLKDNELRIDRYRLRRIKSITVPVVLCAGIYPGSLNNNKVYSYKYALRQCSTYLYEMKIDKNEQIPVNSTAEGVSMVKQYKNGIAIARKEALLDYGLEIIAENISDVKQNFTEFYVVSRYS